MGAGRKLSDGYLMEHTVGELDSWLARREGNVDDMAH